MDSYNLPIIPKAPSLSLPVHGEGRGGGVLFNRSLWTELGEFERGVEVEKDHTLNRYKQEIDSICIGLADRSWRGLKGERLLTEIPLGKAGAVFGFSHERDIKTKGLSYKEHGTGSRSMGADNQSLFNIGGFGRSGDKSSISWTGEGQTLVGLMHVVDELSSIYDQNQVLGNEVNGPVAESSICYPNCPILCYGKLPLQDRYLYILEVMRILHRFKIYGRLPHPGQKGDYFASALIKFQIL
jgi:hypothetical protein